MSLHLCAFAVQFRMKVGFFPTLAILFAILFAPPALAIDVRAFNLTKGAQVWYVSDHASPMIAMSAALPAGSAYDPRLKPGLAAFAAALLDQGAGKLNADAFQTALADRAIRLSVTCSRDWMIVSLVTLTDDAKDAFQLLGMALSQPRFDADAIARVREQILSRMMQDALRPDRVAANAFYGAFFHDHPYAHPISGDPATVSAISAGDLKRFASAHWVGGGLKIAVSGDFDQPTLAGLLKTAFGRLPLKNPLPLPAVMHEGEPGIHAAATPGPDSAAVFGLSGVLGADRDYTAALVANYILGGGPSARLTASAPEDNGIDADVSTQLVADRKADFVFGELTAPPGAMRKTITALRSALSDYARNGPTQTELDDAKADLTESFPLSFNSNVAAAGYLNEVQRAGRGIDTVNNRNALINAVTLDQVRRAARRLFNPSRLTIEIAEGQVPPASAQRSAVDPQSP
jgi:zinc protease